jgi:hypothetical protein
MLSLRVVQAFALDWQQIAEAGVKQLEMVHVVDEAATLGLGVGERVVLVEVNLLTLQRLEEALGLGMVIGVALGRHADQCTDLDQPLDLGACGVLDAAV